MIETIKKALKDQGIATWRINSTKLQACELYFIKKNLDTRRMVETVNYSVTVFRDFEKDGKKFRGSSAVVIPPEMDEETVSRKIKDAYFAASFVANPFYELPKPVKEAAKASTSKAASMTNKEVCDAMVSALYAADTKTDSWVNSAEFYVNRKEISIVTSNGTDVAFTDYDINGEFVTQAKEPKDVELYQQFAYTDVETEALTAQVKTALETVLARAKASKAPKNGNYNVILSEKSMQIIFSFYDERSDAGMIYPGYCDWKIGTKTQGDGVKGEKVNLTLVAKTPYSPEGISMKDLTLTEDGILKNLHGNVRPSYYLGVEPTGAYEAIKVDNGSMSFAEMKKQPYLHVVTFSDFHMDAMSGYFGGEIRLAYLFDGKEVTPVTGGSINGNFVELQKNMVFSTERYVDKTYEGPLAVRFENVPVAGEE